MTDVYMLFNGLQRARIRGFVNHFGFSSMDEMIRNIKAHEHERMGVVESNEFATSIRDSYKELCWFFAESQLFVRDVQLFEDNEPCDSAKHADEVSFRLARPARYAKEQTIYCHAFSLDVVNELPDVEYRMPLDGPRSSVLVEEQYAEDFLRETGQVISNMTSYKDFLTRIGVSSSISWHQLLMKK